MKMSEFLRLTKSASRCDALARSDFPEALIGELSHDERELVRAAIRRVMSERRDNIISRIGVQIDDNA